MSAFLHLSEYHLFEAVHAHICQFMCVSHLKKLMSSVLISAGSTALISMMLEQSCLFRGCLYCHIAHRRFLMFFFFFCLLYRFMPSQTGHVLLLPTSCMNPPQVLHLMAYSPYIWPRHLQARSR